MDTKTIHCEVAKASAERGLVFGYALVSTEGGKDYYDSDNDNIPEDVMLDAAAEFMKGDRFAYASHDYKRGEIGSVLFAFPMTQDIADSLEIQTPRTGLLVGMKVEDPNVLAEFVKGERIGFSVGMNVSEIEDVDNAA